MFQMLKFLSRMHIRKPKSPFVVFLAIFLSSLIFSSVFTLLTIRFQRDDVGNTPTRTKLLEQIKNPKVSSKTTVSTNYLYSSRITPECPRLLRIRSRYALAFASTAASLIVRTIRFRITVFPLIITVSTSDALVA